jgi:hypothetical protein
MKGCGSIGKPKYGLYSRAEVSEELWQEPEILGNNRVLVL